jgi:hypothetical protein
MSTKASRISNREEMDHQSATKGKNIRKQTRDRENTRNRLEGVGQGLCESSIYTAVMMVWKSNGGEVVLVEASFFLKKGR